MKKRIALFIILLGYSNVANAGITDLFAKNPVEHIIKDSIIYYGKPKGNKAIEKLLKFGINKINNQTVNSKNIHEKQKFTDVFLTKVVKLADSTAKNLEYNQKYNDYSEYIYFKNKFIHEFIDSMANKGYKSNVVMYDNKQYRN